MTAQTPVSVIQDTSGGTIRAYETVLRFKTVLVHGLQLVMDASAILASPGTAQIASHQC